MQWRGSKRKNNAAALTRELPSRLSVVYEGATQGVPVHPPDLSTLGMFINTPENFREGSLLQLKFTLVHSGYELNVRATVRHSIPGVGVGVEFVDLSPEAKRGIEQEIELSDLPVRFTRKTARAGNPARVSP